ncbi:MAG: ComEC/Rec2 family competence protein [Treponema sp.]|jgi:competence protein ComEC|nr:ComEC/Rec2 family competence protein [Treponema sp.]
MVGYPVLYAALGAALGYYGFRSPVLLFPACLALIGFISLFRALASLGGVDGLSRERPVYRKLRGFSLCVTALGAGFVLGAAAGSAAFREPSPGLPREDLAGLSGILLDDPRTLNGGGGMGRLLLRNAAGRNGSRVSAGGEMQVFFPGEALSRLKGFGRSSEVYVEGSPLEGQLFRAASVHILKTAPPLETFRTRLRMGLLERLALHSWGGLAAALLLGVRDNLDQEIGLAYRRAGCSHVLALSGMHLAIISSIIAFLLKKPLGLKGAAAAGGVFILGYVFLVGQQPSLERAAIMYVLGALAALGTLPRKPILLLGMAFIIQLVFRPASGNSLSFIFSYLALGGILLIGEALGDLFRGYLPPVPAAPLSASLGAFIATQTAGAAFFGVLYPAGIIAGLVIVPAITLFMIVSIIWLVPGLLFPPLAAPVGIILSMLYDVQERLAVFASRFPALTAENPLPVLGFSLAVSALILFFRKRRMEARNRLAPFA